MPVLNPDPDYIVDYVEIVEDDDGQFRVRARSSNGNIIWTTEKYTTYNWATTVAFDSGKLVKDRTKR